jgi:hypothetical protein
MSDDRCPQCGILYAIVGRAHNCRPSITLPSPDEGEALPVGDAKATSGSPAGDVNEVNTPQDAELTKPIPRRRGEYPNTDRRREYMREYMMKKRRGKL